MIHNVSPHDSNLNVVVNVRIADHAAGGQVGVDNRRNRRSDALHVGVVNGLLVALHLAGTLHQSTDVLAMATGIDHGLVVVHVEVLALLCFKETIDVGFHGRHL